MAAERAMTPTTSIRRRPWWSEKAGQGTDTVSTHLAAYTLGANVENLVLSGDAAHTGNGNSLNNTITGGGGRDSLHGLVGNDLISGAGGNDILHGDLGTDKLKGGNGLDQLFGDGGDDTLVATPATTSSTAAPARTGLPGRRQ
jgi:serralysin